MTTYSDVWNNMNELDMMTSKLGYIKEMIETALEYLDNNDKTRAESLMYASCDYIKYYLEDYDTNFQRAWGTAIQAGKELDDVRAKLSRFENPDNPQYTDEEMEAMSNQNYIKELLE
jgi:DNA repair ATPase RecN